MTQVLGTLPVEDLSAITHLSDRFSELIVAGDLAAAAQLYTSDAVLMPPHHPAASGRAAIQAWMASLPPVSRFELQVDAIDGRADVAYVRGRYALRLRTPAGPVDDVGKYIEIRRRQPDGSWLMESDIFNSDLPERAAPQELSDADRAAMARAREEWVDAMHADRIEGLVAPVAEDTLAFPPHEPPVEGSDGTRSWHQARAAQFTSRITLNSHEVIGGGDWAVERLSYTIHLTPRSGGAAIEDRGPCFWLWRRDSAGAWKIARAIWNSSAAVSA